MILSFLPIVSTAIAEDFGIPKRNAAYNSSALVAGTWITADTVQPNGKIGSQVTAEASSTGSSTSISPLPNVVRLVAFDQSGQSFGSGSYIGNYGEYGLILSNWHVVCESDGLVHVHFPNGFASYGAIILSDQKWDLALIAISKPPQSVLPLPIAQTTPKPSDPLWIAGHGSGIYRLAGGQCVRYLAPEIPKDGSMPQYEIVEISVSARQGDSGGPILNAKGELAGVLFGSDMVRNTAGSYCERVNRFLTQTRSLMEPLPKRPETHFASIERGGPYRLLSESLSSAPTEQPKIPVSQQRKADFAGSSMSFGTRSNPRRYTQPVPQTSFSIFDKAAEKVADKSSDDVPAFRAKQAEPEGYKSVPNAPLMPLSFESPAARPVIQTTARMESLSALEKTTRIPVEISASTAFPKYAAKAERVPTSVTENVVNNVIENTQDRLPIVSEYGKTISSMLYLIGLLATTTLVVVAVRLLKDEYQ